MSRESVSIVLSVTCFRHRSSSPLVVDYMNGQALVLDGGFLSW